MEQSVNETILVVDDEPTLSSMLDDVLTHHGYKLLQANSAEQALKILQLNKVDLLISDITMPGMDGFQLMEEVNRLYPDMKVQLVSGYNENIDTGEVLHKRILFKPFNNNELLLRIQSLLNE